MKLGDFAPWQAGAWLYFEVFSSRASYEVTHPSSSFSVTTSLNQPTLASHEKRRDGRGRVLHCHNESFASCDESSFRSQNFSYLFEKTKTASSFILKSISNGMTGTLSLDVLFILFRCLFVEALEEVRGEKSSRRWNNKSVEEFFNFIYLFFSNFPLSLSFPLLSIAIQSQKERTLALRRVDWIVERGRERRRSSA